jgi:hypothetical protein
LLTNVAAAQQLTFNPALRIVLLCALQTGLFQLVRDSSVADFKKNTLALCATAKLYGMPTILTTSLEGEHSCPLGILLHAC